MKRVLLAMAPIVLLATPAVAAEGEAGLFYPIFNLLLLLAVLVYFGRKPVLQFFGDRRSEIQSQLDSAASLRSEAEERFAQWQGKLDDLDDELEKIRSRSRRRAESERDELIAEATATAERIRSDAEAAIAQGLRRSREILREEAADLAVELAANLLAEQLTDVDRKRLVGEFIERVERDPGAGGPGPGAGS